jgi:hypothetical protein
MPKKPAKLIVYAWESFRLVNKGRSREICATTSKAKVEEAYRRYCGAHRPKDIKITQNVAEIEIAMAEPGVVFSRPANEPQASWTRRELRNVVKDGFAMVRELGKDRRNKEANRKQAVKKLLEDLEEKSFVKQVRGLLWGLDTGLLTVAEMTTALSRYTTMIEKSVEAAEA